MIDFEDLTTDGYGGSGHLEVSDQYSDMGITFNNPIAIDFSKDMAIPGLAHSGSIAIEQCYAFSCHEPIDMKFGHPVSSVSIHVGYHTGSSGGFGKAREIDLIAYDETGVEIARSSMSLRSSTGPIPIEKKLTVKANKNNIILARVTFRSNGNLQSDNRGLIVDDIEFMRSSDNLESANFGSLEYDAKALEGEIFYIPENSNILNMPDFSNLTFGGLLYVRVLNIKPQSSLEAFAGLNRSTWFALRYGGKFNITEEGFYKFRLASDDGSQLLLDGEKIIENDGIHEFASKGGLIYLNKGVHEIEVDYFQAEGDVGLQLFVTPPGGNESLMEFEYGAIDTYHQIRLAAASKQTEMLGSLNKQETAEPVAAEAPAVNATEVAAEAPAGATSMSSDLVSSSGYPFIFDSLPGGASISINGTNYGTTRKEIPLKPGPKYPFKIYKSGYKTFEGNITGPDPIFIILDPKRRSN